MNPYQLRCSLRAAGYLPIPVNGKKPPLDDWTKIEATEEQIKAWDKSYAYARSTGILTRSVPALDIDVLNQEAAEAVEALARDRFEERGYTLVRIGQAPKRAILFRTDDPFKKIQVLLIAPDGSEGQKIEFLGDGQQLVAFGKHPDTRKDYRWHGGEPGEKIRRDDLPYIHEAEARQLVDDAVKLVCREFGYKPASERARKGNGEGGAADWGALAENIRQGRALHDNLRDLAAKLIRSGMGTGAAVNFLRGLMDSAACEHDKRWKARRDDIPRLCESAEASPPKFDGTIDIDQVLGKFKQWLLLSDATPIYAMLGTVAANLLEGDPVWLGLIGPPSSAKTEILNSTAKLPHVVQAATVTPAGLLSGTPKKQADKGAKGGLLRHIGDFGIIVLKDFGSVLSMRADAKAEILAALRELFDGAWTRHLGTDGGRTLSWRGKVGLLFGATGVIDSHYSVIGAMGDRFLLSRLAPTPKGQFGRALDHLGAKTKQMRAELADTVAHLFACRRAEPRPIAHDEIDRIDRAISLVVRLRGAVERDRVSREVEAIYGAEGTARIGLALERLLAGLDTLGVDRTIALKVVEAVAMDSVPPLRRRAYEFLCGKIMLTGQYETVATPDVAAALDLPTSTVRRALEELVAYQLVKRGKRDGKTDTWIARPPEDEP